MEGKFDYKVQASGRINIIGEHIDYCGGKVFPASLSLKNTIYFRVNGENEINLSWTTIPNKISLDIDKLKDYKNVKFANYIAGCALEWQNAGHTLVGVDMLLDCKVPFGSGLSSSASIEVSSLVAFAVASNSIIDKKEIALLAQKAEREYAQVNCGIMDQYASAFGKKDNAILLDCKKLSHTYVPLKLGDYSLIITNCNKPHNLIESKYNERRNETEEGLKILKKYIDIDCLADLSIADFEKYKNNLSGKVKDRVEHIVYECDRVNKAVICMQNGDLKGLGKLLNESHKSLKDLYEVTGIELDTLALSSQQFDGCLGSRMTGAGFGGCTISIVQKDKVDNFIKYVGDKYAKEIGYAPSFYQAEIDDGITIEKVGS